MNLNNFSKIWLEQVLNEVMRAKIINNYFVLEGLPCSGKTSVIELLNDKGIFTNDELRLKNESTLNYLLMESERTQKINDNKDNLIFGDRSIISTICFESAKATYFKENISQEYINILEEFNSSNKLVLPKLFFHYKVSPEISKFRQKDRDRDILEGRIWYDLNFLYLISESFDIVFKHLSEVNVKTYELCSESNSIDILFKKTKEVLYFESLSG